MSLALHDAPLAAAVSLDSAGRRLAEAAHDRVERGIRAVNAAAVRNDVPPLILIAIIAIAAALALIAVIGLAAAWLYYCKSQFGRNWWPVVGVPGRDASYFYFGCRRIA